MTASAEATFLRMRGANDNLPGNAVPIEAARHRRPKPIHWVPAETSHLAMITSMLKLMPLKKLGKMVDALREAALRDRDDIHLQAARNHATEIFDRRWTEAQTKAINERVAKHGRARRHSGKTS